MKKDELEAIERVLRDRKFEPRDYVFLSERGVTLSRYGFWRIEKTAPEGAVRPKR